VLGGDYLKIKVTSTEIRQWLYFFQKFFESILVDEDGNKVQVTKGRFTTESL
jgi:hypothetical protein